jgi:hypothetical protein
MKSLLRLWKIFLQSAFVSLGMPTRRRRKHHLNSSTFASLEPRKLLAGVSSDVVVNAVHDSADLDFDDWIMTVREAVHLANENEDLTRITFAPELNGHTISLSSELSIESEVQLDSLFDVTISGGNENRVFHVDDFCGSSASGTPRCLGSRFRIS